MKKILALLEQKVEWLVLLAGVAFAGYIAWAYIVNSPTYVEINNEKVGPADIDKAIYDGPASKLEAQMHSSAAQVAVPAPHFVDDFREAMNYAKTPAPTTAPSGVALVWPQTPMIQFSDVPALSGNSGGPGAGLGEAPAGLAIGDVTQLPKVPAPQIIATNTDMSYVAVPGQQPAQPAAPAGDDAALTPAAPAAVPTVGMDRTWASVLYTIDAAALGKEWEQIHLPMGSTNTVFVQVLLERQELQSDGSWGDPVAIPPLAVGVNIPPAPPSGKAGGDVLGYVTWATAHQKDILQPAFYTVLKGKKWVPPGITTTVAPTEQKFDPTRYLDAHDDVLMKLTPEQRQQVSKAKLDKQNAARAARRGSGAAPSAPADGAAPADGGGAAPGWQGPNDPDRPLTLALADPAAMDGAAPATPVAAAPARPPSHPIAAAPSIAQLIAYPIPSADFDPGKWADDHATQPLFVGWAHDETVQAGHTYRYRVTYRLKNPVLFANSAVKDAKLADQFDLRSSPSEWSANVEVRAAVNFWLVRASDTSGVATVDIFRWQGGDAKHKTFNVSAGDMIGGKDGNIDYGTGWTIVDMRKDPRTDKVYVMLMDPSGAVHIRYVDADSTDPKYLELKSSSATALR